MIEPTPQDWANWYAHKSNKERWIEGVERAEQEQEEQEEDEDNSFPREPIMNENLHDI